MLTSPFGDWRIRLGITLGVLVFSAGVVIYALLNPSPEHAQSVGAAWWCITITTAAMLGFSALSDRNASKS